MCTASGGRKMDNSFAEAVLSGDSLAGSDYMMTDKVGGQLSAGWSCSSCPSRNQHPLNTYQALCMVLGSLGVLSVVTPTDVELWCREGQDHS